MFKWLVSAKNLEDAYLHIVAEMEADGRSRHYRGWDGWKVADVDLRAATLLAEIKTELESFSPLAPAVLFKIPKKSNPQKLREIYIYNLKDRIKAQAIYQIVEPHFDAYFSPYLFSYRSSHPSYFAARSAVRHYRRYWQRDSVLIGDLSDYSNYIGHEQLRAKLAKLALPEKIERLLHLFIGNEVVRAGAIVKPVEGLVQGVPLIALFNNLYLDDFDKEVGRRTDFYRRVGDDLLMFDRDQSRLAPLWERLEREAVDLGLKINRVKTSLQRADESFDFLGYHFASGEISLPANFKKSLINKWRQQFSYNRASRVIVKKYLLRQEIKRDCHNLNEQFRQLAEQKKLVSHEEQLRQLSESFFRILTRYFFKTYSARHRRLLGAKLKKLGLVSVYKYFLNVRYGFVKGKN